MIVNRTCGQAATCGTVALNHEVLSDEVSGAVLMGYCSTSSSAPPLQVLPRAGVKPMQCSRMHWQIQRLSGRLTLAVVDLVRCGSDAAPRKQRAHPETPVGIAGQQQTGTPYPMVHLTLGWILSPPAAAIRLNGPSHYRRVRFEHLQASGDRNKKVRPGRIEQPNCASSHDNSDIPAISGRGAVPSARRFC